MRELASAALITLSFCAPAHAERFIGGAVKESDVALVFDFLREALSGAIQVREVPPPEALHRRAEAIGEDMRRHGEIAARAAIDAVERDIRGAMRRSERLPGSI